MPLIFPLDIVREEFAAKVRQQVELLLANPSDGKKGSIKGLARELIDARQLVVRTLKPKDLGLATDNWTFQVTAGLNEGVINKELDDKTMVIFLGVFNLSADPQVVEVRFGDPSSTIEDVHIEHMYLFDHPIAVFDTPIIYTPGNTIKIDLVAKGENSSEQFGFLGLVIEPAGRTIRVSK